MWVVHDASIENALPVDSYAREWNIFVRVSLESELHRARSHTSLTIIEESASRLFAQLF